MHYLSVIIGFPSFYCTLFYSMRCLQMFNVEKTKARVNWCPVIIIRKTMVYVQWIRYHKLSSYNTIWYLEF
jgi:hypothetical protein